MHTRCSNAASTGKPLTKGHLGNASYPQYSGIEQKPGLKLQFNY